MVDGTMNAGATETWMQATSTCWPACPHPPTNYSRHRSAITVNSPADPHHDLSILLNTTTICPLVPTYNLSPPCWTHRMAIQFTIQTRAVLRVKEPVTTSWGHSVWGLSQMS